MQVTRVLDDAPSGDTVRKLNTAPLNYQASPEDVPELCIYLIPSLA